MAQTNNAISDLAIGSVKHTTLFTAVKAAGLVATLKSNVQV